MSKSKQIPTKTITAKAVGSFTVQLSNLVPSSKNVRKKYTEASISELAASMSAVGQIQDVRVRKNDSNKFEVVAGGRRYHALKLLMKNKQSVKNVKVTGAFLVRATEQAEDDNDIEISLHENRQREAMHPADECQAFFALHEEGQTPEQIADRHGISHMTVRRRLKLARVSPRIFEAFRSDEVTLDQMQALAISDDHKKQEEAFFDAEQSWQRNPNQLKSRLTEESLRCDSTVITFIGLENYKKRGGVVTGDLFSDNETSYCTDRELAYSIASEMLEAECAKLTGTGWKWIEATFESYPSSDSKRINPQRQELTEEATKALAALAERKAAIQEDMDAHDDEADEDGTAWDALDKAFDAIEAEEEEIETKFLEFNPTEMTYAGVLFCVGYNGKLSSYFGVVKPDDYAALQKARKVQEVTGSEIIAASENTAPEDNSPSLAMAVVEDLTALKTMALGLEIVNRQDVALCVILHPLLLEIFYSNGYHRTQSACEIRNNRPNVRVTTEDESNHGAFVENEHLLAAWAEQLPTETKDLWSWLLSQSQEIHLQLLAVAAGQTVNAWRQRHATGSRFDHAEQIARAVELDMRKYWTPSKDFFGRVTKQIAVTAMKDTKQPTDLIAAIEKAPKKEIVQKVADRLAGSGWLPEPLRPEVPQSAIDAAQSAENSPETDQEADSFQEAAE